ncbi:hypothetical protein [Shewanella algae]|uniref:hypothetical protein n=1 Tax=Shewanella algae TaxID=38313 RepID=UPI001186EA0E|nr:hypothetical protein [Shewanella algae]
MTAFALEIWMVQTPVLISLSLLISRLQRFAGKSATILRGCLMPDTPKKRGRPFGSVVAEPTKQVRVPLGAEDLVKSVIELYKTKGSSSAASRVRRQLKIHFGKELQEDLFK